MNENTATTYTPLKPLAMVCGQPLLTAPTDLYIPPEALEIILENFNGPLDILLYLIRKQNIDVLDIPIARITRQYLEYIEIMKQVNMELAADYLVMAATLAEIKSRFLLPKLTEQNAEETDDPRAELVRRLREYENIKTAAESIDQLPRQERDVFLANTSGEPVALSKNHPPVSLENLIEALRNVYACAATREGHHWHYEALSVRERMSLVLDRIQQGGICALDAFFTAAEGRAGVVVTFVALLELWRQSLIDIVQTQPGGTLYVRTHHD